MLNRNKTKILFIVPNLTPGGIQSQVLLLATFFKKVLGLEITIWGLYSCDLSYLSFLKNAGLNPEYRPDISFYFSREYYLASRTVKIKSWIKLIAELRKGDYKVLLPYSPIPDRIFNLIWRFTKAKISFSFERGGHINPKPKKLDYYSWLIKKSNPVYVSNSNHGKLALATIKSVPLSQIQVIRNAYVQKPITNTKEEWNAIFDNITSDTQVVTMVANFFNGKDHLTVIKAWEQISQKSVAKLVFAGLGGGAVCQQNFKKALDLVEALQLDDSVFFLGSVADTTRLLNYTNIGLLSTLSEGCPNAILEYMGAGLPIVATDIPGVREVIPFESTKYLFRVGDEIDLAEKLSTLLLNTEEALLIGDANKKHVQSKFEPDNMYRAYADILERKGILRS